MDWRTLKFDWNRARAFLVTAEEGSLSAAARSLGMAQPTLSRQVTALEHELRVTLFERVGRGLTLTPSGIDLLEHVRRMGDAASHVRLTASGQTQAIEGLITIAASELLSAFVLPPSLARLRQQHPGIQVKLIASNATRDLRRGEADIALRGDCPTDKALLATRLRDRLRRFYATRAYSKQLGHPTSPSELGAAQFIAASEDDSFLGSMNARGFSLTLANLPIRTESHLVLWEMVKHGLGIGLMLEEAGDAEPQVVRVLPELSIPGPCWLVAQREVHTSRTVRTVFDLLASELS